MPVSSSRQADWREGGNRQGRAGRSWPPWEARTEGAIGGCRGVRGEQEEGWFRGERACVCREASEREGQAEGDCGCAEGGAEEGRAHAPVGCRQLAPLVLVVVPVAEFFPV